MATTIVWCEAVKMAVVRNGIRTALIDYSREDRITLSTFKDGENYQGMHSHNPKGIDEVVRLATLYVEST